MTCEVDNSAQHQMQYIPILCFNIKYHITLLLLEHKTMQTQDVAMTLNVMP